MNPSTITWRAVPFDALTTWELHDILRLRTDVFVVEQNCPYAEVDGLDGTATHILGMAEGSGLVAYSRVLAPAADGLPHIGRVVVRSDHRGRDLGRACMEQALTAVERIHGSRRSALSAQAHLKAFYASFGFKEVGAEYLLDDIPHIDMLKQ